MKILIVKIGAIGDVVMARGMIEAAPAGSEVSWLCGATVASIVREFEGVSEILEIDDKALLQGGLFARARVMLGIWLHLLGRRFDLVVTGHSDRRYGLLSATAKAAGRRSFASHPLVPGQPHPDEYARLVAPGTRARMEFLRKARPAKKSVLLFPGGAKNLLRDDALRRWPLGHYVALTSLLLRRGYKVTIAGADSDAWVLPMFRGLGVMSLIGRLDLPATLDVCAAASHVVTHDSGPMHLALATPTRVVAIFGPTTPAEKVLPRPGVTVLWGGKELGCRPCYDGKNYSACADNECMSNTTPAAVMAAIEGKRAR